VRTLYYFLPALEEVLTLPPEPGYFEYLAAKLQPLIAEKSRLLAPEAAQPSSSRHRRQTRHIPALPDRR
jgi:hypothetical protein